MASAIKVSDTGKFQHAITRNKIMADHKTSIYKIVSIFKCEHKYSWDYVYEDHSPADHFKGIFWQAIRLSKDKFMIAQVILQFLQISNIMDTEVVSWDSAYT